jgi:hypothetical protein
LTYPSRIARASAAPHAQAHPVVGRRTRFQPNQAARNSAEERQLCGKPGEFWPQRLFAFELRCWPDAARV